MNSPDANELLAIAIETLLSRVLPVVPKEREYDVRMIARAMAISQRELSKGSRIEETVYGVFSELVKGEHGSSEPADPRKLVAGDIREGRYDEGAKQAVLQRALRQVTSGQLELSNPKLLGDWKGAV